MTAPITIINMATTGRRLERLAQKMLTVATTVPTCANARPVREMIDTAQIRTNVFFAIFMQALANCFAILTQLLKIRPQPSFAVVQ
jgi:hypothetical protein